MHSICGAFFLWQSNGKAEKFSLLSGFAKFGVNLGVESSYVASLSPSDTGVLENGIVYGGCRHEAKNLNHRHNRREILLGVAWVECDELRAQPAVTGEFVSTQWNEITKGGLLVGGAHGRGVVYEKGQHIGYADLTQMSAGFQAGLQDYSELIVFENQAAMDKFKRNEIYFSANASAVYTDKGAAASAQFVDGVAVFVRPVRGAMAEASVGGQQITYISK